MDKNAKSNTEIKFSKRKTHEAIPYETQPVVNIVRASFYNYGANWVAKLSSAFITVKISSLDDKDKVGPFTEEPCPLGALISPHHTKPIVEINKTFKYSNKLGQASAKRTAKWIVEISINNLQFENKESLIIEYIDTKHIVKRLDDWAQRVDEFIRMVRMWLVSEQDFDVRKSNKVEINEEMMRTFNVPPREMFSSDIVKKKKVLMLIKPFALWVIGGNGRIDLLTQNNNYIVIDRAEQFEKPEWSIFLNKSRTDGVPFTKDILLKIL